MRCALTLTLALPLLAACADAAFAQSSVPTPAATPVQQGTSAGPQQQVRELTEIAARFVPAVKRVVEGAMLRRYTFLATVLAQIVMLAALIKLQAEKPGATRDFFAQVARFIVILPFITLGPWLVSYFFSLGYHLVAPLRVPLEASAREFDDSYYRFTMGMFTATDRGGVYQPMPTGTDAIIGVLSDRESTAKTVDEVLDPAKWDMTKLFTGLNITRGVISFALFILIVLSGFLAIAFRLAVPWMIALSLDKSLAHEVSYKFARGVVVYTLVFPVVAHVMQIVAYKIGTLGLAIYDGTPMYNVDPETARLVARPDVDPTFCFGVAVFMMAVSALCLVASPVLSWKIAFGQTFEGVATVASGWMAAIVGSGINFVSARVGAALNNMAERLQVETTATAGLITARADYTASVKGNAAGLHNQLGQIAAARAGTIMTYDAAAQREQANLLAAYRNSVAGVQISRQAQSGVIEADRSQATRGASNQAARDQQQALIGGRIGENNVEQGWWNFGADALGAGATVATGSGGGGGAGHSVSGLAMRPSAIMNESNNVDIQMSGSLAASGEYLSRTARSNEAYAQDRQDVETTRASQTKEALVAQYGAQSGAISVWNAQVNTAADTQAAMSGRAATESTAMLDEAAWLRLGGAEEGIARVRAAGLQAAEWHRMAQIIGQVSHDITRRIEEMGQYHF